MGAAAASKLPGRSVFRFYSNYLVGVVTASRKERYSERSGYSIAGNRKGAEHVTVDGNGDQEGDLIRLRHSEVIRLQCHECDRRT